MANAPQVDWSRTNTYIGKIDRAGHEAFNLFGLSGDGSKGSHEVIDWWPGDASQKPQEPPTSTGQYILNGVFLLSALGMWLVMTFPSEKVTPEWRGIYDTVVTPLAGLYSLGILALLAYVAWGILQATLISWLFPDWRPKRSAREKKFDEEQKLRRTARTLTVMLVPPRTSASAAASIYSTPPLELNRNRHSPAMHCNQLPHDRVTYVTLKDLTDAEHAHLTPTLERIRVRND